MKKFLTGLVLATMFAALPTLAQSISQTGSHDSSKETCNTTVNGGFKGQGTLTVKMFITAHYTMADFDGFKKEALDASVAEMNDTAVKNGYTTRFEAIDWDSTKDFNFIIFVDIYNSGDNYTVSYDVHGWGQHHLFTTSASASGAGDAFISGIDTLPAFFENGWTCGN